MKLELGIPSRRFSETGMTKGGYCFMADVTRLGKHEQSSEVLDFWSDDTKQDTFFTQSAMDICFTWLERTFPGFSRILSGM